MPFSPDQICTCLRCEYSWVKRVDARPVRCPNCKQPNWDTESPGRGRPRKVKPAVKGKKAAK